MSLENFRNRIKERKYSLTAGLIALVVTSYGLVKEIKIGNEKPIIAHEVEEYGRELHELSRLRRTPYYNVDSKEARNVLEKLKESKNEIISQAEEGLIAKIDSLNSTKEYKGYEIKKGESKIYQATAIPASILLFLVTVLGECGGEIGIGRCRKD